MLIDLLLMRTMLLDLSVLKVRPAQFTAKVQRESKAFPLQIVETLCLGHPSRLSLVVIRLSKSILELYSYQLKKKDYRQSETGKFLIFQSLAHIFNFI